MNANPHDSSTSGNTGRVVAIILVAAVAVLALAWALGLFNVDASGKLQAPDVKIEGGEVPDVQVETADVSVGTETATIEVPTVDIDKPGDDGSANR
ncbi:hypothetical protein ACUJ46_01160 [Sandaracinobacteroides sp. A072]|uniref:hypothetical protein n=1 Tax=Sandaracinobacteroides sp. A072 TaxID=3461146 RepID=UPI004042B3D1